MGTVFLQILPLALAAIAPTMIGLVVLFLSDDRGLVKALVFILGKIHCVCDLGCGVTQSGWTYSFY
jgi:hypothetical protein